MEQKKYLYTAQEVDKCFGTEIKVGLYGAGAFGKKLADYIISSHREKQISGFFVTKKEDTHNDYKGIPIYGAEELSKVDCFVIIAASAPFLEEMATVLQKYGKKFCCMTGELYDEIDAILCPDIRKRVPFAGLDFMLAGFSKCGTTSLHKVLMEIDDIYLSKKKESAFFRWCDSVDAPMEDLAAEYFDDIREGQLVGMIEPDFSVQADKIQYFFGRQIKLIFCVRNPVDAVFSRFKMNSRLGFSDMREAYQKNEGVFGSEIFDLYFNQNERDSTFVKLGNYADWLEQFLEYYTKDQIKIVLFEDMVKYPREIINDILSFLGSTRQYKQENLPVENEGNFVMADIEGLRIAEKYLDIYWEYKYPEKIRKLSRDELFEEQLKIQKQFEQAGKIYNVKMTTEQRKYLQVYYCDSVRKLEKMINRDLSEIWF